MGPIYNQCTAQPADASLQPDAIGWMFNFWSLNFVKFKMDRCDMGITVVSTLSILFNLKVLKYPHITKFAYYEVQLKIKLLSFVSWLNF